MRVFLFLLLPFLLFAKIDNSFYNSGNTGWFFGENNETNETNKTKPLINPYNVKAMMKLPDEKFMHSIPLDNLDLYSANGFHKIFTRAKGIAVMHPTRFNVYVVKKMQKFMTDQATKFARVWYVETIQNPNELGYPGIKANTYARNTQAVLENEKKAAFFKKHLKDLGFVVFYNPKDKMLNIREKWIINMFKKQYGNFDFVWIDVTKRPDLVKKFNIKVLPDMFFVYKNPKGEGIWARVKTGLCTLDDIVNNTIFVYKNIIAPKDKK